MGNNKTECAWELSGSCVKTENQSKIMCMVNISSMTHITYFGQLDLKIRNIFSIEKETIFICIYIFDTTKQKHLRETKPESISFGQQKYTFLGNRAPSHCWQSRT